MEYLISSFKDLDKLLNILLWYLSSGVEDLRLILESSLNFPERILASFKEGYFISFDPGR